METKERSNKELILTFYEEMLNNRKTDLIKNIVSEDYVNDFGSGLAAFQQGVFPLLKAFPDIKWQVMDVIAEDNKVIVFQKITGTHRDLFQNIPATGNSVNVDGFAMYKFRDGKIVSHKVITDGRAFLQQLGVLPQ